MTDFEKRIYNLLRELVLNKPKERTEEEIFVELNIEAENKELYHNALDSLHKQEFVFQICLLELDPNKSLELPKEKLKYIADIHVNEYKGKPEQYVFIDPPN